jgi:glycosyltransferase involved in cell wall biosynthesis
MLASAYAACDVFALPSLFETPGIAALEAGLAGAKIAITPFGGTKDYFGPLADYTDPYSVDSIRRGIRNALNRKKDSALREHIKKEFLWSRVAEKTKAVYQSVLGK